MKKNRGSFRVLLLLFMTLFSEAADENSTALLRGKFRLACDKLPQRVLPFSQLDFSCRLSGKGEAPQVNVLFPEQEGLAMRVERERKDDGSFHERIFHYTLLTGDKAVNLPSVALKAYDPATKLFYSVRVPPTEVGIEAVEAKEILDSEDSLPKEADFSPYLRYLYGILVFAAGFLSAMSLSRLRKKFPKAEDA